MKSKNERTIEIFLVVLTISLFFLGISNRDLWTPDEPRVAEIGREMGESGNFVVPTLNKKPFLEQPPLFYASLAIVFKISGYASDTLARVPVAIYALLGAFATFLIGRTFFGRRVGLFSALILSTSFEYFRVSRWVVVDSALSCFVYFSVWAFLKAYFGDESKKNRYYLLFYIFATLAFFVKGFIGIGVPAISILIFLVIEKNLKEIKKMNLPTGIALFLVSLGIWTLGLLKYGGLGHVRTFFVDNNLMRFLPGGTSGHHHPFYYYFHEFPPAFLPWFFLLVPAILYIFSEEEAKKRREILFFKCYFIGGFILFSLAATKRVLYLLPIFSPAAIIVAFYIESLIKEGLKKKRDKIFFWIYGIFLLLVSSIIVPASFKIAKAQGVQILKNDIFILFFVSALGVFFSVFAFLWLKRRDVGRFFFLSTFPLFTIYVFLLIWVCPYLNQHKSFKPFVKRALAEIPPHASIFAYKPDETIRGFFPFYTGIYLKEIGEKDELRALSKKDGVYIVIRDKDDVLSKDLLEMGFEKIFRIQKDRRGSLALFRSRGSP